MRIINRSVPLGTILIIYESRPDVTIEAAATAFKAGNKILLKGGSESNFSNNYLVELWQKALLKNDFDKNFVSYLNISRQEIQDLIRNNKREIDVVIPRGGDKLIEFVIQNSSAPVIVSGRGNNFIYIDDECDIAVAERLILNGKQRISVCNALDKILINKNIKDLSNKIEHIVSLITENGVEIFAKESLANQYKNIKTDNSEEIIYEEFLAPKMYISLVDTIDEAIATINKYAGLYSAVIATTNEENAELFMTEVDCAAVYHNASSRFTDGGQFGVGAEIAISTQKIHFRGPLGAQELVTNKWFVYGEGHIRQATCSDEKKTCN